jgi:predicted nucleic acid-binding protein
VRVYLDNCCFNRPFDDQGQIRIRLESEAKLHIQERVSLGEMELAWSYILDYESEANPFEERKRAIARWREHAAVDVEETPALLVRAKELAASGLKAKDALHVACAIASQCDYFVTTDDGVLRRAPSIRDIRVVDPPTFVRETQK